MKVLILGGDGMLGHQLLSFFSKNHTAKVTLRQSEENYSNFVGRFNRNNTFYNVDVLDDLSLRKVIEDYRPDAVINAVGIIKQRDSAKDSILSLRINALFPHLLSEICAEFGARMFTISTDCVFAGNKGNYKTDDFPDANDLYGRTKYLGEVNEPHCVTLRSSIIGLELHNKKSLIEWFLSQKGTINGFSRAFYTGLTTIEMARVIEEILINHKTLFGVWQVASEKISKYDLLAMFSHKLSRNDISIEKNDVFYCDRSLDGKMFCDQTGYKIPSWESMLEELAEAVKQREAHYS